jgi:hypothetical protein
MTLGRLALFAVIVAALALAAAQAAGANNPSTASLAGEEMLVQDVTLTTLDCDPAQVSTVGYAASGVATGPYPGTFTVQGTVTIQPQTQPGPRPGTVAGPLASLSETFTIDSALGTVTGTKSLPPSGPAAGDIGSCQHVTGFATGPVTNASGTVVDVFSQPVYTATVQDTSGTTSVTGDASLSFTELNLQGTCGLITCDFRQAAFDQFFLTSTPIQCDDDTNGQGNENPGCQGEDEG